LKVEGRGGGEDETELNVIRHPRLFRKNGGKTTFRRG